MNENMMNAFCDYLEDIGAINYTEVWECGPNDKLYGRTFTPESKDRHRIEIYENDEHTNEEILCHELAHVMLYKIDGPQDHGEFFRRMERQAYNFMNDFLKEEQYA